MIFLINFLPLVLLIIYFASRSNLDPFEPIVVALTYSALNIAISGVSLWMSADAYSPDIFLYKIGLSSSSYFTAATLHITTFLAFLLGYSQRPIRLGFRLGDLRMRPANLSRRHLTAVFMIFALVVLGVNGVKNLINVFNIEVTSFLLLSKKRFIDVSEGDFSAAMGYTRWMAGLTQYAALLFLTYSYARSPTLGSLRVILAIGLCLLMLIAPFLTSSRLGLLTSLLSILVILHYMRKPLSFTYLFSLSLVGVIIFTALGELRSYRAGGSIKIDASSMLESISEREDAGYVLTAKIIEDMPRIWEYQKGSTFVAWIFAPIPRSIWPEKPTISLGQEVKVHLFGRSAERGGGIPPSSSGEFYINFGLYALILSPIYSFIGGAISKSAYWSLVRDHPTPFSIFTYALLYFSVIPGFFLTQFSNGVVNLMKVLTLILLLHVCLKITVRIRDSA